MPIKIKEEFNSSTTKKVLLFLFSDKKFETRGSILINLLKKLYIPYFSEVCLLLSIAIVWYKSALGGHLTFVSQSYIPIALIVLAFLFSRKNEFFLKKSHVYYLIFLLVSIVSGVLAALRGINPSLILLGWLIFAQFGLAYYLGQTLKENILNYLIYLSLPMTGMGLYQFLAQVKTPTIWLSEAEKGISTRVFGFLGSPNILGVMLAFIAIISFGIYLDRKKKLFLAISLVDIFIVFLSFSRSAWFGLAFGMVFALFVYNYKYLLATPALLLAFLSSRVRDRILIIFTPNYLLDSTLDGRIWAWINGLYILGKYPLFGTGPGTYGGQLALNYASPVYLEGIQNGYTAIYFTDNQALELLVQVGIIGFLIFMFFVISVFSELASKLRQNNSKIVLAAMASFACFLFSSLFANNLEFTAVAVPIALILGVVND